MKVNHAYIPEFICPIPGLGYNFSVSDENAANWYFTNSQCLFSL
jgi:hypothetical protein